MLQTHVRALVLKRLVQKLLALAKSHGAKKVLAAHVPVLLKAQSGVAVA